MNSLVKVFSNFKEFYSEINGATLTGAIDVIVVEQADGTFVCSPFHVRFGKLGVLRSREKIVDIEVNGEPVDIHMKLGESGEAFFVEECADDDYEQLPINLATSPIPPEFQSDEKVEEIPILMPRRNSIDITKENEEPEKKYENQVSDYKHRRHTDNTMHRRNLSAAKNEFTTQKIRQEWAEHEQEQLLGGATGLEWSVEPTDDVQQTGNAADDTESSPSSESPNTNQLLPDKCDPKKTIPKSSSVPVRVGEAVALAAAASSASIGDLKDDPKTKKRRRKRSAMRRKSTSTQSIITSQRKSAFSQGSAPAFGVQDSTDSYLTPSNDTEIHVSQINDFHFFSDTEVGTNDSRAPSPIKSDSELEISHWNSKTADDIMNSSASWKWGELPTPAPQLDEVNDASFNDEVKQQRRMSMISNVFNFMKQSNKIRKTSTADGVYLSDLETEDLDPEIGAMYFPPISSRQMIHDPDDHESGNGTSLPHSPSSIGSPKSVDDSDYEEGKYDDSKFNHKKAIALSLCGGLENGVPNEDEFERHLIQYTEVCQDPKIFSSPLLVVRIDGKYYNWTAACPIVLTSLVYRKPLPIEAIDKLVSSTNGSTPTAEIAPTAEINQNNSRGGYSWWYWRRSGNKPTTADAIVTDHSTDKTDGSEIKSPIQSPNITISSERSVDESFDKYRKTLRLSSEQIESLNLKEGVNEVVFSVTTAYQGTSRCKCYVFRWKHSDKVVISDIDGTITKSDVLGHILPMVGRDWAQLGVTQLFSKIENNGYKMLYLSARAIGQSRATREYLRSICQGDVKLPDGPLLLNPTSLISAFHREVIERKPEQFKIACLSDIQALFPQNPFYAGYGNRINDVWAYRAVGIPIMRIFTINPKGELKHELTQTFQSTYRSMANIVDQLFPPVSELDIAIEYTNVNYWREPMLEMDESMFLSIQNDNNSQSNGTNSSSL